MHTPRTLHTYLSMLDAQQLPLERFCTHGGFPDARSWHIARVDDVVPHECGHVASFVATFVEHQGAGCGGQPQPHHHLVDGEAHLHADGTIHVQLRQPEPSPEF